jgi:hypothetical protein
MASVIDAGARAAAELGATEGAEPDAEAAGAGAEVAAEVAAAADVAGAEDVLVALLPEELPQAATRLRQLAPARTRVADLRMRVTVAPSEMLPMLIVVQDQACWAARRSQAVVSGGRRQSCASF